MEKWVVWGTHGGKRQATAPGLASFWETPTRGSFINKFLITAPITDKTNEQRKFSIMRNQIWPII